MQSSNQRLGSGARFSRCVESVTRKGGADDPRAVCAAAGFRKYGKTRMLKWARAARGRGNPEEPAAAMFEKFHGRPSDSYTEFEEEVRYHSWLAELGRLISLTVAAGGSQGLEIGFRGVTATTDEKGGQIYFTGGDQALDLARLGFADSVKQFVKVGPCVRIEYHTTKDFHNFEPIDYYHFFGEDTGELPDLAYDLMNQAIFLVGGAYVVKREGIVN